MTEEQKQQVAVFRFGVIHEFTGSTRLDRGETEALLREKCVRKWEIPFSTRTRISRSTIVRWVSTYLASGGKLESLYPRGRNDAGRLRAVDEETGLALLALRREKPKLPVSALVELLDARQAAAGLDRLPSLSTVYRFLHQHDLMAPAAAQEDRRKFEAELPNDLWQSDVMHGPLVRIGEKRRKSYLIAFLDDHSRLIPHGAFYPSEGLSSFLEAFSQALLKRGLPRKLYVDNGSAFRSRQLEYTSAALGIALVHARPYRPQGKGKIERFFRTVQTQWLPSVAGESLDALNGAFERWLHDTYHPRIHSSTGQSPFERFTSRMECLRAAPPDLRDYFRQSVRRRVNKDRSVVVHKRLFEAPVELVGKQVEILYHPESPELVEIRRGTESWGFHRAIDLAVNSRVARTRNGTLSVCCDPPAPCDGGKLWEAD
ncbi:MAG: DDE-type integrase/transposase/recombinase [Deferrisomatales bacterium]|nr:DDE-type integrase/transposase/recombinase [Deferrisomatales bacterium]